MTTLRDLKEHGLLALIGPFMRRHTDGLPLPIGDDVAITEGSAQRLVWTIDTMVEGTHFRWYDHPLCTPERLAEKLVASNVSDLASKGAEPLYALLSLGAPAHTEVDRLKRFYDGLEAALDRYGLRLIGGDTVGAPQWTMTLAVTGTLPPHAPIAARSAAQPGMTLYATGSPGESAAGFHLLNHPTTVADGEALILRHLAPTARLRVGQELIRQAGPLAMIDLSDGLGKDARELARQSNLALILDRASLPVSEALRRAANATGQSAEHWLLNGGEDYELLFATHAPEELLREITGTLPLHRLGRVEPGNGVWLASGGGRIPLSEKSFDHFAK